MRGMPLTLCALLALTPIVASLPQSPLAPPALPADLSDADLLRLIAAYQGIPLSEATLVVPPDATLPQVTHRLAARAGVALTPAEDAELRALDPRIAAPTLLALLAIEQAWDLRDEAFAAIPPEDMARLRTLDPTSPEAAKLAAPTDQRALYAAAILLLDTLEGHALPALRDAARVAPWPATPLVDNPVLRLGGTGDDTVASDRILQLDPAGNDLYRNNAGASTLLDPATLIETPIAVSIDFAGNDRYDRAPLTGGYKPPAQGSGLIGIGVLLEYEGDDTYISSRFSHGVGGTGIGLARDAAGNDARFTGDNSAGWSDGFPGILRDDQGDDNYSVGIDSGGASSWVSIGLGDSLGLLWDRGGRDRYETYSASDTYGARYGWARTSGTGWLVDEGFETDFYQTAMSPDGLNHGCNDCSWVARASASADGRGNDNDGGLAALLSLRSPYAPR